MVCCPPAPQEWARKDSEKKQKMLESLDECQLIFSTQIRKNHKSGFKKEHKNTQNALTNPVSFIYINPTVLLGFSKNCHHQYQILSAFGFCWSQDWGGFTGHTHRPSLSLEVRDQFNVFSSALKIKSLLMTFFQSQRPYAKEWGFPKDKLTVHFLLKSPTSNLTYFNWKCYFWKA